MLIPFFRPFFRKNGIPGGLVLIEHIVDWNIQTKLSGEHPRIHGVQLSVAYSNTLQEVGVEVTVNCFMYMLGI